RRELVATGRVADAVRLHGEADRGEEAVAGRLEVKLVVGHADLEPVDVAPGLLLVGVDLPFPADRQRKRLSGRNGRRLDRLAALDPSQLRERFVHPGALAPGSCSFLRGRTERRL